MVTAPDRHRQSGTSLFALRIGYQEKNLHENCLAWISQCKSERCHYSRLFPFIICSHYLLIHFIARIKMRQMQFWNSENTLNTLDLHVKQADYTPETGDLNNNSRVVSNTFEVLGGIWWKFTYFVFFCYNFSTLEWIWHKRYEFWTQSGGLSCLPPYPVWLQSRTLECA